MSDLMVFCGFGEILLAYCKAQYNRRVQLHLSKHMVALNGLGFYGVTPSLHVLGEWFLRMICTASASPRQLNGAQR